MAQRKKQFINLNFDGNLDFISNHLRVLHEILQRNHMGEGGPWGFKNEVFEMRDGRSTHGENDEPDFVCGNIQIKWYKHIGRGMEINRRVSFNELCDMFNKCRDSLSRKS